MTPAFESFIARLYVDEDARRRFLVDPRAEAEAAGLGREEVAAAIAIDRVGLELAAAGFAKKRRLLRQPSALVRVWRRITAWSERSWPARY
jgi:hypothetical protein